MWLSDRGGCCFSSVGGGSSSEEGAFAAIPGEGVGILQGQEEGQGGGDLEMKGEAKKSLRGHRNQNKESTLPAMVGLDSVLSRAGMGHDLSF